MHKLELIWIGNKKLTKLDGRSMMLLEGHRKKYKIESVHIKSKLLLIKKMYLCNLMKEEFKQEVLITFHLINKVKLSKKLPGDLLKILAKYMMDKRTDMYLLDKL